MRFVDQADIVVSSGKGGAGCVSFRREKYVPKGGPDGGDGGRGGDVVLEATNRLQTLYDFTHRRVFRAKNGRPGEGSQRSGAAAPDLIIHVPVGTLVYDRDTDELAADLVEDGQRVVIAAGGIGGQGNRRFATSTNRAPRKSQPGLPGQERRLRLDLKLLADVALVGLPNAGKSTLISNISAARPKVADYPFTTLIPNLGVVVTEDYVPFVVADIPGLIAGASQGVGLGHHFLRHIERTRLLVFLLDASARDDQEPLAALETLERELARFKPELARRQSLIALNKTDLAEPDPDLLARLEKLGRPVFIVSALTGRGVDDLVEAMARHLGLEMR